MLRDSVCDEVTNTERCLFDGGDCCLEHKDKSICQNCSCILAVDRNELKLEFELWQVQPLQDQTMDFFVNVAIEDLTMTVQDVVSGEVCAILCMKESDKADNFNAWHYDNVSLSCQCGWIESTTCPDIFVQTSWTDMEPENDLNNPAGVSFVQLAKTIPCSNKYLQHVHQCLH